MAYKRDTRPQIAAGRKLTSEMVGIGMLFAAAPTPEPDIEDTLISASIEGMEHKQLRVLAILATWIGVRARRINVDRLARSLSHVESERVSAFWAGVARWQRHDRRFARLSFLHRGGRVDVLPFGSEFHLERDREDARFVGGPLCVPAGHSSERWTPDRGLPGDHSPWLLR